MNSNANPTQCERLKRYLEIHGSVTQLEALEQLGILNGAARILELRQQGMPIVTKTWKVETRHGTATVARYVLKRPVQLAWFENERRAG